MTIDAVQNLYNDYRSEPEYSVDYALNFFQKNTILFNSFNIFPNSNELQFYIHLCRNYLEALYRKDRYNETADNAIKFLRIIDSEIERLNSYSLKDDSYYGILFFKKAFEYEAPPNIYLF